MLESVFLNLVRGNRINQYLRLKLENGAAPKYSRDYSYIEIPAKEFFLPSEEKKVTKVLRNQHVQVIPACTVDVQEGYRVLVKTNPKLQEIATCPALFLLDHKEGEQVSFYATFRKDFEISELEWAVRIYMIS